MASCVVTQESVTEKTISDRAKKIVDISSGRDKLAIMGRDVSLTEETLSDDGSSDCGQDPSGTIHSDRNSFIP